MESSGALNEETMTLISDHAFEHSSSRLDKFQFGDLACRFIACSFARSSAFAILECIRRTLANTKSTDLDPVLIPFQLLAPPSVLDSPGTPVRAEVCHPPLPYFKIVIFLLMMGRLMEMWDLMAGS
jgi:hypothetical protein